MTATRAPADIVAERLRVVLAFGDANAAHHRAQARLGGAQIAMMGAEEALSVSGGSADLAALDRARQNDDAARDTLTQAEARLAALEGQLAALDRELATAPR